MSVRPLLSRMANDESGSTAIEYGLIIGIVGVGMIATSNGLAAGVINLWTSFSAILVSTSAA